MNVLLWSGGKDCVLTYYKMISNNMKIDYLITFLNKEGRTINHNLEPNIINIQSELLGIPVLYLKMPFDTFSIHDKDIKEKYMSLYSFLYKLKKNIQIDTIIGGHVMPVYGYLLNLTCKKLGIKSVAPLVMKEKEALIEFLNLGFESIIIYTKYETDKKWLGEKININNKEFIEYINKNNRFLGNFHTLVTDGPIFKKKLKIIKSKKLIKNGIPILDIIKIRTVTKN
jgi:diphthine-ammonia ligase